MYREKLQPLSPESCPFRTDRHCAETGDSLATCGLVATVLGAEEILLSRVERDACEACCRSFPPSVRKPNPVVASLLHGRAAEIVDKGGVAGCSVAEAGRIRTSMVDLLHRIHHDQVLPPPNDRVLSSDLARRVPSARQRFSSRIHNWAVGVTTAPRRVDTLEQCLDSLVHAGWNDPYLFIDSAVRVPGRFAHLPGTFRDEAIGAWPNYYLALAELLMRRPDADAFLIVQDDVLFYDHENLRKYLESALWPGQGIASLYCSSVYTRPKPGWSTHEGLWVWGAQAFVFPRELAKQFIVDQAVFGHRWDPRTSGLKNIDVVIGRWALDHGHEIWYPTPSLVQHIGETSTLSPNARALGPRRANRFVGDSEV